MFRKTTSRIKRSSNQFGRVDYQQLEMRKMLTTWVVNTLTEGSDVPDGLVSLREAVVAASTNSAFGDAVAGELQGDRIEFSATLAQSVIEITAGELAITENLVIDGQNHQITIKSDGVGRLFSVNTDQRVTFRDLKLRNVKEQTPPTQWLQGTALHVEGNGITHLTRMELIGNQGSPELRWDGATGVTIENARLVAIDSVFRGFSADGDYGQKGGALRVSDGSFFMFGGEFRDNASLAEGAGIYAERSTLVIKDALFEENDAGFLDSFGRHGDDGGALYLAESEAIVLESNFTGNWAADDGGAIASDAASRLYIRDSNFDSNFSTGGGAISSHGDARIVSSTFTRNGTSGGSGGALLHDGAVLRVIGSEFTSNGFFSRLGGAIYTQVADAQIVDSVFDQNLAFHGDRFGYRSGFGGAVFIAENPETTDPEAEVRMIGATLRNNAAHLGGGAVFVAKGARLHLFGGGLLEGNETRDVATFTFPGGGAVANFGVFLMQDVDLIGNRSASKGGAILSADNTYTRVVGGSISGNSAVEAGGGIFLRDGAFAAVFRSTIGGSSIEEGNLAGVYGDPIEGRGGGAFVSENARLRLFNTKLLSNSATHSGGGAWVGANGVLRSESGSSIRGNQTLRQDGGGLFNGGGHLEIRKTTILENKARSGGGLYVDSGSLTLTESKVNENEARYRGGGLYNRGHYQILDSIVSENEASEFDNIFDEVLSLTR